MARSRAWTTSPIGIRRCCRYSSHFALRHAVWGIDPGLCRRADVHGRKARGGAAHRGGRRGRDAGRRDHGAGVTMTMTFDQSLPVIFMALMGLAMLVYVISDGYDL